MTPESNTTFRSRILSALLWSSASAWGTKLVDFAVTLILARLLIPADFGLVSLVNIYITLANVFVEGGFAQAIIQREQIKDLHYDTAFWTSVTVGLLLTVSTYVFGPSAFEYLFKEEAIGVIVQVTSILFTVAALRSVQQAILTRRLHFKQLAIRRAAGTFAGGLIAVYLALRGAGVWSLVALHMVNAVVGLMVLWIASDWRPRARFSRQCLNELLGFSIHLVGRQLLGFVNHRGLSFLIGLFMGTTALGYYVLANRIVLSILQLITNSVQSVAFPAFSRLQNNRRKLRDAFFQAVHFTSLITLPTFVWMAATAVLTISILVGSKWLASVPVLQLLCLVALSDSVIRYSHSVMLACGKSSWSLNLSVIYSIGSFIGFFIAFEHGIVAVAIVYVVVGYLVAPLVIMATHRLLDFTYTQYLRELFPACLGSAVLFAAIMIGRQVMPDTASAVVELSVVTIFGSAAYLFAIRLIDRSIFTKVFGMVHEATAGRGARKAKK